MISTENISKLLPASEVVATAKSAELEHQVAAVARAINTNANTGVLTTIWNGSLLSETISKLEAANYTVTPKLDAYQREIPNMYVIVAGGA